jgi:uncharacterized protein HemY
LRISTRVLERRIKLRFVVVKHRQNRQILLLVVVVVFTALCSMVSIVKSLFLLSKSARDFFSMKEIRASRGEERAFLFVWFL